MTGERRSLLFTLCRMSKLQELAGVSGGGDDWVQMQVQEWVGSKSLGGVSGKAESGGSGTV